MRISMNSITDSIRKKAYANWLKDMRSARKLFTDNVNVYDLFDKIHDSNCENTSDYVFLIKLMSNLEVQELTVNDFSSVELANGVIMTTISDMSISDIYKKFYEKDYITDILEKNLNRNIFIK